LARSTSKSSPFRVSSSELKDSELELSTGAGEPQAK